MAKNDFKDLEFLFGAGQVCSYVPCSQHDELDSVRPEIRIHRYTHNFHHLLSRLQPFHKVKSPTKIGRVPFGEPWV